MFGVVSVHAEEIRRLTCIREGVILSRKVHFRRAFDTLSLVLDHFQNTELMRTVFEARAATILYNLSMADPAKESVYLIRLTLARLFSGATHCGP